MAIANDIAEMISGQLGWKPSRNAGPPTRPDGAFAHFSPARPRRRGITRCREHAATRVPPTEACSQLEHLEERRVIVKPRCRSSPVSLLSVGNT